MAEADTSYLPHILGWKLKPVSGTAVKGPKKLQLLEEFDPENWIVKFNGVVDSFSFVRLMGLALLRAGTWRTESEHKRG